MNIYVGNLSYEAADTDLEVTFKQFGNVTSARVVTDRFSGRSRGFGFVEMASEAEARAAIQALNGKELKGRSLTVNEAKPKTFEPRSGGSGSGGFGGGDRGASRPSYRRN